MKSTSKIILAISFVLAFSYWWVNYYTVMDWPIEKTLSSPENEVRFLKAHLKYLEKNISPEIKIPEMDVKMKDHIAYFLKSNALKESIGLIKKGEQNSKKIKLHLILVLDFHGEVYGQPAESQKRQQEIYNYFLGSGIRLGLAENISYPVDWENIYEDLLWVGKKLKLEIPYKDFQDFKENFFKKSRVDVWWKNFLENSNSKHIVVGVDQREMNFFMTHFKQLKYNPAFFGLTPKQAISATKIYYILNFHLREQVILAHAIRIMQEYKEKEAVLIIGAKHMESLSRLCVEWGIKAEIYRAREILNRVFYLNMRKHRYCHCLKNVLKYRYSKVNNNIDYVESSFNRRIG